MRLLWHRLTESPETRLQRIRRLGFVRFCALYALVFPACHVLAASLRAWFIGRGLELNRLPLEIAGWSAAGAFVAAACWLAGSLARQPRGEPVPSRSASSNPHDH